MSHSPITLDRIDRVAGAKILRDLGVRGTDDELVAIVSSLHGSPLAITAFGHELVGKYYGDVRRFREVNILADTTLASDIRRVGGSYERQFSTPRMTQALRVLGLFDRPASGGEIRALLNARIPGLTDEIGSGWADVVNTLRAAGVIGPVDLADVDGIDGHPLVRAYMAERLRADQPAAWQAGHERLYRHLAAAAPERPETMHQMEPLFAAVRHGCAAGLHQEVLEQVVRARIDRGREDFASKKLGAFGARLAALAHLFDAPFARPAARLAPADQSWLWNEVGWCLHAMGRASDARAPVTAGLNADVVAQDWRNAAISASNLAALHQGLSELAQAESVAERAVELADQSQDAFLRMVTRTVLADARVDRGHGLAAIDLFASAEAMQAEDQPDYPMLYSLQGYRYCALLLDRGQALAAGWQIELAPAERASWSCLPHAPLALPNTASAQDLAAARFAQVRERATTTLAWVEQHGGLLTIALNHLTLGRSWLLEAAYITPADPVPWMRALEKIHAAVRGLRDAGSDEHLPLGLLQRAAWHRLRLARPNPLGPAPNPAAAHRDLDEAQRQAQRDPFRLHLADVILERAHLHLALRDIPSARALCAQSRALIERTGYLRRAPELDALECAIADARR